MNRLPSPDEQRWLTHALEKLIAKRGIEFLDAAPLVEPTNEWFPEPWSATAAHAHRLAQRLLHYAGLGALRPTLSAYAPQRNEDGTAPWDAGTAGWFAGIRDGRAHFGLHVDQFGDPEAAAGVLAHEVAHAWRAHHRLVIGDRDKEELLTDVTTVALGFGILSTNNTDRYRSGGTWSETAWSISSAGYLPPQSMAFLLALWCAARAKRQEAKIIERHLEPNQRASFRAAMDELSRDAIAPRDRLTAHAPSRPVSVVRPEGFVPDDPRADEIDQPQLAPRDADERIVHRMPRGNVMGRAFFGAMPGAFVAFIAGASAWDLERPALLTLVVLLGAFASAAFTLYRSRGDVCSDCEGRLEREATVCPGCHGTIGGRIARRERRRVREEELDRRAARDVDYDECEDCRPEQPCPRHVAEPLEIERQSEAFVLPPAPPTGLGRRLASTLAALFVVALLGAASLAWWRQNHVDVYFDNALERPLTLQLDGERIPFAGRLALHRRLAPGRHELVLLDQDREVERLAPEVRKQGLLDALLAPRLYLYSAAGAGIYERARLVYSTVDSERITESTLIGLTRWIEQEPADHLFRDAPDSIASSRGTRTLFHIARNVGHRELAMVWSEEGRVDDAVRALQKAIERNPCDGAARGDLVELLVSAGRHEQAVAAASAWIAACDADIPAHRAYQNLLAGDEGLQARYRERARTNATAANHYLYGRLAAGEDAVRAFREALRLDPHHAWARSALGYELLMLEEDAEAFSLLDDALRAQEVAPGAPVIYAMAAVAANRIDDALARIAAERHLDPSDVWTASWNLARAKEDWDAAKVLLADLEQGQPTPETRLMRARIAWLSNAEPRASILADLRREPATAAGANLLAFEEAFAEGRFAEAARMEGLPGLYPVYVAEARILAGQPVEIDRTEAVPAALLDAATGRIGEKALLVELDSDGPAMRPHAWFALAVRAAADGDRANAARLFRKAAQRALDREHPYRVALAMARRYDPAVAPALLPPRQEKTK